MLSLKGSSKDCRLEYSTMVCAAIRAANMLLPGGPGAQKDTLICVPPSSLPSVSRCASSAISAVANSSTAKRRKLPSCPWANCGEKNWEDQKKKKKGAIFQAYREKQKNQKTLQPMNKMHTHREWKPSGFHLHPQCSHILAQIWRERWGRKKKKKISWNL